MPPVEATPAAAARIVALDPVPTHVQGWGGGRATTVQLVRPEGVEALRGTIDTWRSRPHAPGHSFGAIARGMGRSYGDAAQISGGLVLDTTRLKDFQLDPGRGILTAQAGVTLGELLRELVPAGWMLPVVPGTQHVTVAGAIASDIHGKNHAAVGTFGNHVRALGLLTAAGDVLELQPGGAGDGLFEATVGGMGLTGVILWAQLQLRAVSTPLLSVDTDRVATLDDALAALSARGGPHRVAWLDLLGSRCGRGVVTRADHVEAPARGRRGEATVRSRATVPQGWPGGLLRASTVRAFNELRFRRTPRLQRGHVEPIGTHMFPLDALDAWPRLYGRGGLLQYQLVVPPAEDHVLHAVIGRLRRRRVPCFLAVLKDFGQAGEAPLSFPIEGWTLALDLPRAAAGLYPVLDECDRLVLEAGGRVYLSKDARLRPETVKAMYPRLEEWRAVRDQVDPDRLWQSDLARRTGLVEPALG
jgi:decaprenylphospho-beta-D-ribofuranose 2-oxidase